MKIPLHLRTEGVNRWSMGNTSAGGHFVPDQNDIYDIGLDGLE